MQNIDLDKCPICDNNLKKNSSQSDDYGNIYHIQCEYCGDYQLLGFTIGMDLGLSGNLMPVKGRIADPVLSIAIRHRFAETGKEIVVSKKNQKQVRSSVIIPQYPIERVDILLKYMSTRFQTFEEDIIILKTDYPLLYARSETELHKIIEFGQELDYIRYLHPDGSGNTVCRINIKGWDRIRELTSGKIQSQQAFVAMKFGDKELDRMYLDAIAPAIVEAGFVPYRIDKQEHNEKICDKIISEIRQCGFLIADFTGHRGGVYFEAGFALGLGKPVIWCCRESDLKGLHFDVRQYNQIIWSDTEDLKERLLNRIKATIVTS